MVSELSSGDSDRLVARLNSKNYALWEFQFRIFVEGKGLLGWIDGSSEKPDVAAPAEDIAKWKQGDAKVKSLILGSVDPTIVLGLRLMKDARSMWKHLETTYSSHNVARQFEVQTALDHLEQGDRDISTYYNDAQELWTEQDLLTAALRSKEASAEVMEERQQQRVLTFLMRLRPEYEAVRSSLINQDEIVMDGVLGKLLREESRLRAQSKLAARPGEGEVVFAAAAPGSSAVPQQGSPAQAFAATRPQFQNRVPVSELECHHCHVKGHLQKHCRQRNMCVYCKKPGHIVLECPSLQNRRRSRPDAAGGPSNPAFAAQPAPSMAGQPVLTTEAVEGLVQAALQRSLPTALSSAFASLQMSGREDGEAGRARE
ncbi:unnamed protein product [Linum tenue]|uniref:CCHC-type domain-containing protein n=1 Tax=Linum tenue TaxID=586396 RepID=A0AAV0S5M4_9ROSI|nr:unnamed protein product [Linum tenue]